MSEGQKESLYEKLVRCSQLGEVPERLRFYDKPKLLERMGVVFRENYVEHDGKEVLLKVQSLLQNVSDDYKVRLVEEYMLMPDGLVCDGQMYEVFVKKERFRIENAFREVKVLDYLARQGLGERYVQRLFCPDIGWDHELFFAGGDLYLRTLMEMKQGVCLGDTNVRYADARERDFGIMHPRDIVRCAADLADDLLVLRGEKIFHNDIKRANVLREIGNPGESKFHIVDFGSARFNYELVDTHLIVGTDGYRAPEIMKGHGPNMFSDAWSLGVLLYAEITGQLPFMVHEVYKDVTEDKMSWMQERLYRAQVALPYHFLDAVSMLLSGDIRQRDLAKVRDVSVDLLQQPSVLRDISDTTQRIEFIRKPREKIAAFAATRITPEAVEGRERRQRAVTDTFQEGEIDVAALHEALGIKK